MLVACWSSKGGAGTTVVAAALAAAARARGDRRRRARSPTWPATCPPRSACPTPTAPGSPSGWRPATTCPPTRSAGSSTRPAAASACSPRRPGSARPGTRPTCSAALLAADRRPVVVDCGTDPTAPPWRWRPAPRGRSSSPGPASSRCGGPCARRSGRRRSCCCRSRAAPSRRADVEDCVGAPVVAEVAVDPQVAARRRRRAARHAPAARPRPGAGPCRLTRRAPTLVETLHAAARSTRDPARVADLDHVRAEVRRQHPLLPERRGAPPWPRAVAARATGLGPLEPLLADDAVTEVMVNGRGAGVDRAGGRLVATDLQLAPARGRPARRADRRRRSGCGPTAPHRRSTPACPTGRG